jgi:uncharacterized membrane protein YhhN
MVLLVLAACALTTLPLWLDRLGTVRAPVTGYATGGFGTSCAATGSGNA